MSFNWESSSKMKIIINREQGAVAPLVAILIVLFILCLALVVDLGHLHNVKVQLQRAVDASALAGARQLDGSVGQDGNARNVARATAAINRVDGRTGLLADDGWVDGTSVVIALGSWNPDITANDRFATPPEDPDTANAIKVTATLQVDNIFFFLTDNSTVTADAIAVAKPSVPVLPLAVVSCIPGEESQQNPGSFPGTDVCDIRSYTFGGDNNDFAAWTSLTKSTANEPNIEFFLDPATGREEFQKVIFGKEVAGSDGLENEIVDVNRPTGFSNAYEGCKPNPTNYLDINCGLGRIAGKDIARPDDFPPPVDPPPSLKFNDPATEDYYIANPDFDPLTAYDPLPRWYNLYTDDDFTGEDHFTRIWTQDGILLRGPNESFSDYNARIENLLTGADKPFGDQRFMSTNDGGGGFIGKKKSGNPDPETEIVRELDYVQVMKYAGYPKVYVNNGEIPVALKTFVENILEGDGTLNCSDNEPFPQNEQTVRVNMPVIFAGSCESFKALSGSDQHVLTYVGMAKFLLTRAWVNPDQYDCGENFVDSTGHGCEEPFDPDVASDGTFSLAESNPHIKGLEGINLIPVADDDEDLGNALHVFLVK
jgi:Flp pilus assembly protein TadG